MTRATVLRGLLQNGRDYGVPWLEEFALDLDLPVADVLVVAGHPVPGHLLPPERDQKVLREFAYRVTYCNHMQLTALGEFLHAMPDERSAAEPRPARDLADPDPFPAVLRGLMANRGFGAREVPFVGLSRSTIAGMLGGAWHQLPQLQAVAGLLGWRLNDLAVLASEPVQPLDHGPMFCRHVGAVFLAAVPRTSKQLTRAAHEADRLSSRQDDGLWRPVSKGIEDCPDAEV
ncbi:hypothetical protein [Actinoplanes utahensis]|uniref:Uncharacterized protein n=1 Tax=Actinoplanes utahensis TaxID=1869 RepID=A0A0A6UEX5_ACTUT|nr:hypothetical protein [Actinoplanes utahensis]KHD74031.1 hypothetical protein MB27_31230 [Actinoplanes utahensis]